MVSNKQRLGETLAGRMAQTAGASVPTTVELGVINANLSLTTDSIKTPIPKDQYMVDIRLAGSSYQITGGSHTHSGGEHAQETGTGAHTHTGGEHTHALPSPFRKLKSGDRVLVVWAGSEPCVVCILVSGQAV